MCVIGFKFFSISLNLRCNFLEAANLSVSERVASPPFVSPSVFCPATSEGIFLILVCRLLGYRVLFIANVLPCDLLIGFWSGRPLLRVWSNLLKFNCPPFVIIGVSSKKIDWKDSVEDSLFFSCDNGDIFLKVCPNSSEKPSIGPSQIKSITEALVTEDNGLSLANFLWEAASYPVLGVGESTVSRSFAFTE